MSNQLIEAFGALLLDIERSLGEYNAERQRPADLLGEDEIENFIHAIEHLSEEVFV